MHGLNIEGGFMFFLYRETAIYANLWAVMHNKSYWTDPEEFRPERFLDPNGCFQRDERCIPFMIGKRHCIGQVQLLYTIIMHKAYIQSSDSSRVFFLTLIVHHQIKLSNFDLKLNICAIEKYFRSKMGSLF